MTLETYEKAQEICSKIEKLESTRIILNDSLGGILHCTSHRPDHTVIDQVLINDKSIIQKLIDAVDDEISVLQMEFSKL